METEKLSLTESKGKHCLGIKEEIIPNYKPVDLSVNRLNYILWFWDRNSHSFESVLIPTCSCVIDATGESISHLHKDQRDYH